MAMVAGATILPAILIFGGKKSAMLEIDRRFGGKKSAIEIIDSSIWREVRISDLRFLMKYIGTR